MNIRIVQALHVDGHAALAQRRPTSCEPRWTRGRVGQVGTYRSRWRCRRRRRHRFSLVASYRLRIWRAVCNPSGGRRRLLQIARVMIVYGYRGGTLLLLSVTDHSGGGGGSRRSFWRCRRIRVHWHCRMSAAKRKKKNETVSLLLFWPMSRLIYDYQLESSVLDDSILTENITISIRINVFKNINFHNLKLLHLTK